jgi:hypothetical protein
MFAMTAKVANADSTLMIFDYPNAGPLHVEYPIFGGERCPA